MRTIQRIIVSALIFSKDGKLLMGMKDPHGGGADEGETQIEALHRELLEEAGINTYQCTVGLVDDKGTGESKKILKDTKEEVLCKMQFNVYRVDMPANADSVELKTNDDLVKLEWVDVAKLSHYKLTPPSRGLFMRLGYL